MNDMSSAYPMNYVATLQAAVVGMARWQREGTALLRRAKALITYDWLVQAVLRGEFLFFQNAEAFAFLKLEYFPLGNRLCIYAAGGNRRGLLQLQDEMESFASQAQVRQIVAMGRKGFKKWPKQDGWRDTGGIWIMKEL